MIWPFDRARVSRCPILGLRPMEDSMTRAETHPVRLEHANLVVRDIERAIEFYRDIIGFEVRNANADGSFALLGNRADRQGRPDGQDRQHLQPTETDEKRGRQPGALLNRRSRVAVRIPSSGVLVRRPQH